MKSRINRFSAGKILPLVILFALALQTILLLRAIHFSRHRSAFRITIASGGKVMVTE